MASDNEVYLGIDLGASSGRVMAGVFDGAIIQLVEVNRFENGPVTANDRMYWDVLQLWGNIQRGLRAASERFGRQIRSAGVDTWGVDYCLLGAGDEFLGNPYHYRDRRTAGGMELAFSTVSREDIFAETGLQFMELNTLYQLLAVQATNPEMLASATTFLMIPDLFHWLLTGEKSNESTNASTTQLFNPVEKNWSARLLNRFGLPKEIFLPPLTPGTRLGGLRRDLQEATGLTNVDIVLPGTHDTASAVMAVPVAESRPGPPDWCYISSGTWSLMGIESPNPIISETCRELNFTNEGGVGNSTRVLKNIAGLWLVQECRRNWAAQGTDHSWDELVEMAASAPPLVSLVNPDGAEFVSPRDMVAEIASTCERSNQSAPAGVGATVRLILESLALRYRMVLQWLEELNGAPIDTIHIVGGGAQNRLLCQMAADACNRQVLAGPVEATVIGNVMLQAVAAGRVASIAQARQIIRQSFPIDEYQPLQPQPWDDAYERFTKLFD